MKKIVVKRADGGVSIIIPADGATPDLLLRDALRVEGYVSHREVEDADIPSDRILRNAWIDDGILRECPIKSRAIIREKRNANLQELDKKAMSESRKPAGKVAEIDAEAQRLRDIPQDIRFNSNDITVLKELLADADIRI